MSEHFPLFIQAKDSGEVTRFDSIEELQRQLERIDVENGEYDAWDRSGKSLRLRVQQPVWLRIDQETSVQKYKSLSDALNEYAVANALDLRLENASEEDIEAMYKQIKTQLKDRPASKGFIQRLFGLN